MKKIIFLSVLLFLLVFQFSFAQNKVLHFDGINDMVNLGGDAGDGIRSIELWFKPAYDIQPYNIERISLVTRNTDNQAGEFGIYIGYDFLGEQGRVTFTRQVESTFYYIYSDDNYWLADQWYHVAAVIDPGLGMMLYIDGVLQEHTDPSNEPTDEQTEMTTIGCWGDKLNRWFAGEIDEVRFWNRALTFDEINQNMCDTVYPPTAVGLQGYWRMNEGEGHTVIDYGDLNRNGDIFGCTYLQDTLCLPTKINAVEIENSVNIIPNPIMNEAIVIFPNDMEEAGSFMIFDSMGSLVDEYQTISGNSMYISRNSLKSGIYYYKLQVGHNKFQGKLIFI